MTGLVRKATLLSVCGLLVAAVAMASVPSPGNCTVPACIKLVAKDPGGLPDPTGTFSCNIRDVTNAVVANSSVVVDFSGCCNDVRISTLAVAGQIVDGATKTVRGVTDAFGDVSFTIMGAAGGTGFAGSPAAGCAKIYADGQLITDGIAHSQVEVATYDLDGAGGINPADASLLLVDYLALGKPRDNMDCAGGVNPADASYLLLRYLSVYALGAAPYAACP